jgi:hypothetical protein
MENDIRKLRQKPVDPAGDPLADLRREFLDLCLHLCNTILNRYSDHFAIGLIFQDFEKDRPDKEPSVITCKASRICTKGLIKALKTAAEVVEHNAEFSQKCRDCIEGYCDE